MGLIKPAISLQDLREKLYARAKSDKSHRFWGLYVHVCKLETLEKAYEISKKNGGVSGPDGITFETIERTGRTLFLEQIRTELVNRTYRPGKNRRCEIPKENGKTRILSIPSIKDRVVQGAVKLILEPVFEADFCPNSYGYRPGKSPHHALAQVRRSLLRGMTSVMKVDLSAYFDHIRHHLLLSLIAKRIQDDELLALLKKILKASGKEGVPQGGSLSPLLSNLYLTKLDWIFEKARCQTIEKGYDEINYHRWADDIVIMVNAHPSKRWMLPKAWKFLNKELQQKQVTLNTEKTITVQVSKGESFTYLGFDIRKATNRQGKPFILLTPCKKSLIHIRKRIKQVILTNQHRKTTEIIQRINPVVRGWVNYYRVGHSNRAFSNIRDYVEQRIRRVLAKRTRKRLRGFGWKKWSSSFIYGILGLYYDYHIQYLPSLGKE